MLEIKRPLRDYQELAIRSTINRASPGFRGYYTLPTGTGKTRVITGLVEHYAPMGRVLVVAHREELIYQGANALKEDIAGLDVGICMADQNDVGAHVIVGSIQTLRPYRLSDILNSIGTLWGDTSCTDLVAVIFDECHHVTENNSYRTLIDQISHKFPQCRFIGCTATPFRADTSSMHASLPVCTFERSIPEMIKENWLCPVVWSPLKLPLSLEKVTSQITTNGRDFATKQIEVLYSPQSAYIAEQVKTRIEGRPTVVFAASVAHAEQLSEALNDAGLSASMIDGTLPKSERAQRLDAWRRGDIQVMVNCAVLTEGFDYVPLAPNTEGLAAVVIARPTMSPSLYLQMIGRGTRLKPGVYQDCLIIDTCGNANLLSTKQILLPKVMPTVTEEEIDQFEEDGLSDEEKAARKAQKEKTKSAPFAVRINDGGDGSWLSWGLRDGVYFSQVGEGVLVTLLPDPEGTGLFYGRVITKGKQYEQHRWRQLLDPDQPVTLAECMQHVNLLVARSGNRKLLDKDARWRLAPPSEKQLALLSVKEKQQAMAEHWTKGDISHVLTWKFYQGYIKKLQQKLEGQAA